MRINLISTKRLYSHRAKQELEKETQRCSLRSLSKDEIILD